jgi:hypothetical protein
MIDIYRTSTLILSLCIPATLYLSEARVRTSSSFKQYELIAPSFRSVEMTMKLFIERFGTLKTAEVLSTCNAIDHTQQQIIHGKILGSITTDRKVPWNVVTVKVNIKDGATGTYTQEKLLELNGYPHIAIAAKRENDCWTLKNNDGTIMFIPLQPITAYDFERLPLEQANFIVGITQRHANPENPPLVMNEEQAKLFSTLPAWFQRVLCMRYGVTTACMVYSY